MMKFFFLSPQLVASRHRKLTYTIVFNYPWTHRLSREHSALFTIWVAPDNLHSNWHTGRQCVSQEVGSNVRRTPGSFLPVG